MKRRDFLKQSLGAALAVPVAGSMPFVAAIGGKARGTGAGHAVAAKKARLEQQAQEHEARLERAFWSGTNLYGPTIWYGGSAAWPKPTLPPRDERGRFRKREPGE